MRGIFAILLVACISFPLIGPVVFAQDADSQLPACCRGHGAHHCSMMASMMASQSKTPSGPSLRTGPCPFFPAAKSTPPAPAVTLPGLSQAIFAGILTHPACRPQTEALCRIYYSRTGQKRGPPAFLS
jgi:hypothetical protein